jgi:enterobacterial common antigen flippase
VTRQQDAPELMKEAAMADRHSYSQILKSSALIGSSTVVNLVIAIVRAKAMAVWLGPTGFGLMTLYSSIIDLTSTISGMGLNSSGVRQIAEAVGTGDAKRIALTAVVLRRTAAVLGALGALLLIVFSRQVSILTFGGDQHDISVKLLSAAVFFSCLSGGQVALIQGTRRISDLVKIGILGAAAGAIITILLVYFLREDGIIPSILCGSVISLIASWWHSRKIKICAVSLTLNKIKNEVVSLLKLGFVFMASGLMMTGASYAIRVFILYKVGFEAAGLYQSAWTLGGIYIGIILGAMGTDFYPRLTAAAKDNITCNRLVNEQTLVGVLLAGPGVTATLTLAPLIIPLLYSSEFQQAVDVLRWLCLGMTLRVISWPMGFIILAKGAKNWFFLSELAWTAVYVAVAWACVNVFGVNGAGIAFFISYMFHVLMIYLIVQQLSGFQCSSTNLIVILILVFTVTVVFCSFYVLSYPWEMVFGIFSVIAISVYSIRALLNLVSLNTIPRRILRLLAWFRLVRVTT